MNKVATRLEQLETIISESLQSSGKALAEIHDKELFKATHDTWESYCKDRWGYAKAYGYRLIANSKTMERVSTIVDSSDKLKASHLSEISKAPEKQQAAITATVLERCESEGRAPTANDFKREVAPLVVKQEQTTPKPEPTPEPEPKKDWQLNKAAAVKYIEASVRAVDDLHAVKSDGTSQGAAVKNLQAALEIVKNWG